MNILIGWILLSIGVMLGYFLCALFAINDRCTTQNDLKCRCKDCQKTDGDPNHCGDVWCEMHQSWFDKDGFCSYGSRKTDKNEM